VAGCRCQLLADVKQLEPVNLPLAEVSYGSSVCGDPLTPHFRTLSVPITSAVYKHCVHPTNVDLGDGTQRIQSPPLQLHTHVVKKHMYFMQAEATYKLIITKMVVGYLNTYPRSFAKEPKKHNRQHDRKKVSCCFSTVLRQKCTISFLEFRPSRR
jgi:hypothetical protein